MPIFEFYCPKCNKTLEIISRHHIIKTKCPDCDSIMNKTPSVTNFKVNGYNAKNGYHKTRKQQFIEDGPYMAERRLKKDGKPTANQVLNNKSTRI